MNVLASWNMVTGALFFGITIAGAHHVDQLFFFGCHGCVRFVAGLLAGLPAPSGTEEAKKLPCLVFLCAKGTISALACIRDAVLQCDAQCRTGRSWHKTLNARSVRNVYFDESPEGMAWFSRIPRYMTPPDVEQAASGQVLEVVVIRVDLAALCFTFTRPKCQQLRDYVRRLILLLAS